MRIPLLCSVALLCAAGAVNAQAWPAQQGYYNNNQGYYPGQGYANNGYANNGYGAANYPAGPPAMNYGNGYPQMPQFQSPVPVPPGVSGDDGPGIIPGDAACGKGTPAWCWGGVEYAWSFIRSPGVNVPLVSTSSVIGPRSGALDAEGTTVLLGTNVSYDTFSTLKGEFGVFLDEGRTLSLEAAGLWLLPNHETFTRVSDANGSPAILRPAFSNVTGNEIALIDALPGVASGRVDVINRAEMNGFELNARCHYCLLENQWYVDGLAGFRYLRLAEQLVIRDQLTVLPNSGLTFLGTPAPDGSTIADQDSFRTSNKFYGAQIGGRVRFEGPWWLVHFYGKTALGVTDQDVHINGQSRLVTGVSNNLAGGGILALPSNIGTTNLAQLGFVPEVGLNIGFKIHQCVQITAGYSFLFWSQVVRPADVIDRTVNTTTLPTAGAFGSPNTTQFRPTTTVNGESFWVHSLSLRLAVAF